MAFNFSNLFQKTPITISEEIGSLAIMKSYNSGISLDEAYKIPAFKMAMDIITNTIANLEIKNYQHLNNEVIPVDHELHYLFNFKPNPFDTAFYMKKQLVENLLLYGIAYVYKSDQDLYVLDTKHMSLEKYTDEAEVVVGEVIYKYSKYSTKVIPEDKLIIIKIAESGILENGEVILRATLNGLNLISSTLYNGTSPAGVLKTDSKLTKDVAERLRESWKEIYTGAKNSGKTVILESGMEYQPISNSLADMQMVEQNSSLISEIARLFNLPESMISTNGNKYDSLEQNNIQFLQLCLQPILSAIENSFDKEYLDGNQSFFRFDTAELIRVSEKEKIEIVEKLLNNGLISFSEAREKLDLPMKGNMDYFVHSLGHVLRDTETDNIINLNTLLNEKEEKLNE